MVFLRLWTRLVAALAVVMMATPARAQLYTWHDDNGHLVLSNVHTPDGTLVVPPRPRDTAARPFGSTLRATPLYDDLIAEHARANGVRQDLVRAVVQVESAFNPYAQSSKGALGLMQLMPGTMQRYGVSNPFNPAENVRAGVAYLRELLDRYGDNEQLALAAYNAGPGAVDKHGQAVPPYAETRNYVSRVTGLAGRAAGVSRTSAGTHIYKVTEIIDGREVVRFTDRRPN